MSAPNTIRMEVLLKALAALLVAEKQMRGDTGQWLQVMNARIALQVELGSLQPVQVEGGAA